MVNIETLMKKGYLSKINELEKQRYVGFFSNSYRENLSHNVSVMESFPRWSIISGYYAMHDLTKLFLAKEFGLKVEYKVHSTTIDALRELLKSRELLNLMERGYREFITLANDLAEAKKERVKAQYYTGTDFMRKQYSEDALEFSNAVVAPYVEKLRKLVGE